MDTHASDTSYVLDTNEHARSNASNTPEIPDHVDETRPVDVTDDTESSAAGPRARTRSTLTQVKQQ